MPKRRSKRVRISRPVNFQGTRGTSQGQILDLSPNGGRIYQEGTAVHCGMRVTLRIALPDSMDPVEIQQAVVAWTSGNEFGVQFSKTSSDIQRRVRQVFSQLLEAETAEQDDRIITLTFPHAAVS